MEKNDSNFLRVIRLLDSPNQRLVADVFYDAVKLIHYKQERMAKPQLRKKEFINALLLVHYHYSNKLYVQVGELFNSELATFIGKTPTEKEALDYYQNQVMGTVEDKLGRKVTIDENGMKSIYKDNEGEHTIEEKYFNVPRAKRLPWIRYVIQNTSDIYWREDKHWINHYYIGHFALPKKAETGSTSDPAYTQNYMCVVREQNGKFTFVSAYTLSNHNRLLKTIEQCNRV